MKQALRVISTVLLVLTLCMSSAMAQEKKRGKFGEDPRHSIAKRVKFKPSDQQFQWKMVTPWSTGLLFYDIAVHFCDSVRLASAGRLDIKPFPSGVGEIVPAFQVFDAVAKGSVQAGHDWPGYWKGHNEAFVAFGSVPFGLDAEGYNIWLYERGGLEMMQELYGRFNLIAFPGGQCGQEMGLLSNKPATKLEDYKDLTVRTVGWYMDILNQTGASSSPMPGGEVFTSLKTGLLDAAEFSSPAINYPMGLGETTKYALQPGAHQPGVQCAVFFNQDAWNELPEDLRWIVKLCAQETQLWSYNWINSLNPEAIRRFKEKIEILKMDKDTLIAFRKTTKAYIDGLKAKYPDVKKVIESQEAFIEDFADWREARSGVTPWPYETYISGKITE